MHQNVLVVAQITKLVRRDFVFRGLRVVHVPFADGGLIRHSRTEVKQRRPKTTRLAFGDQVRWSAPFKFLHFGQQPRADFFGLHQLLEFVVNALNLPQLRGVNRADWVSLLPISEFDAADFALVPGF